MKYRVKKNLKKIVIIKVLRTLKVQRASIVSRLPVEPTLHYRLMSKSINQNCP